uniref:Phage major capsid protein n=1 Tax=Meloidogyne hapla TaxID=6305 RepID=A0A1I8C2H4_MELHA
MDLNILRVSDELTRTLTEAEKLGIISIATKEATSGVSSVSGVHSPTEFSLRYIDKRRFDSSTGLFTHPDVQKQMTLKELIIRGLLNPDNVRIVDRVNGTELKLLDAIQKNIVDDVAGTVRDTQTGEVFDFSAAIRQGLVKAIESSRAPVFEERQESTSGDAPGLLLVERKRKISTLPGPSQPKQYRLSVGDSHFGQEFSSTTAAATGGGGPLSSLTVSSEIMVEDPSLSVSSSGGYSGDGDVSLGGSRVRFGDIAIALKNIQNDFISLLQQQIYDVDEKCVENPSTKGKMSIREAVESCLFDVITGNLVHPISGHYYTIQTSQEKGQKLIDALAQLHKKHEGLPGFRRSEQQFSTGSVVRGSKRDLIFSSSSGGYIDHDTAKFVPLDSAFRSGDVSPNALFAVDSLTGREFTLTEAEEWGIVNIPKSYYFDKKDNKRYSFTEAVIKGKIYENDKQVPEELAASFNLIC